jgi:CPA2 family monovalent cation:H+ antiporter-2
MLFYYVKMKLFSMENHLPHLITDLALILGAALVTTLIFKRLKQPLVLGYIIAGLLVGPNISIFPTVADPENVKTLAEIGVIFLLFNLGLEFSFKKLMHVGGAASITAMVEIVFVTVSGYFLGRWMGWSVMDSVFLGGLLASSSTTIIIRAFDELGVKSKKFARIVFGVLVVEDIVVILLMVMLSTMAVTKTFEGAQLSFTVVKLVFFLLLWFITGIFLLPTFLKKAKRFLDEETLLILSIGLCLGMVVLATKVGFSAELGAFIMGSIFAETTSAEKVEHLLKPVKDLFGAVFFVSVGMMIDFNAIIEYRVPVLLVTGLTIFGKLFSTSLGALISGQPLKQSIQVGMSMAQIGEFAFIIATLGISLGVTSNFLFPIAVGASAITTFTTPYMIRFSEPFYNWVERIMPAGLLNTINKYSSGTQDIQATSEWKQVLRSYALIVVPNAVIIIAIILISSNLLLPFSNRQIENGIISSVIVLTVTFAAIAPFLWAMVAKRPNKTSYRELWLNNKFNRGPLVMVEIVRVALGIILIGFLLDRIFSGTVAVLVALPVVIIVMFIFSKRIKQFYQRIEMRFLSNLNERETAAVAANPGMALTPWDVHITEFKVNPLAPYIDKSLLELSWREQFGINIALITRGAKKIYAPSRNEKLFPYDKISVIGTDEQLQKFKPVVEGEEEVLTDQENGNVSLEKILIDEHTKLRGLTIRESQIRERANGLVVGIERNGNRILNPDSSEQLQWEDIVWIVGDKKMISGLVKKEEQK